MVALDEGRQHGLARGVFAFVTKPTSPEGLESALDKIKAYASPRRKKLLVIEDDPSEQLSIGALLGCDDIDVTFADTGLAGLSLLIEQPFDCVVRLIFGCLTCPVSKFWRKSAKPHHSAISPS